jgi:lipopolysaccharide transport system ATP-binding protein
MTAVPDTDSIIEFRNVSKIFRTYPTPRHRLMQMITGNASRYCSEKHALNGVSFSVRKGDRIGIVGVNGSGKSTLLKVLCGVLSPSTGSVTVRGRISALLELGAGFNPALTGMENLVQYCELQGMTTAEIHAAIPGIEQFAELGEAIHHPVKTYSSGMAVRLGFSCAVYTHPDILIVDEALSVGDSYFQNKCMNKIKSMLESGVTFLYVTHAADSVRHLCNRGLWMDGGNLRMDGSASDVGAAYQKTVFDRMVTAGIDNASTSQFSSDAFSDARRRSFQERVAPLRTGSGEARILDIHLLNAQGDVCDGIEFQEDVIIRIVSTTLADNAGDFSLTLGITDHNGNQIVHVNSADHAFFLPAAPDGQEWTLDVKLRMPLCPGEYGIIAGVARCSDSLRNKGQRTVQSVIDGCFGGARFRIAYPASEHGINLWGLVHVPATVSVVSGRPHQLADQSS